MNRKLLRLSLGILCLLLWTLRTGATVYYVNANNALPVPPFTTWATAATNIQDAINVTSSGDTVLVTNGVYAYGGKSEDGVITNRISVDKAILVQSVSGPGATVIQGAWDPTSTNGPGAIRCAWMTNNAILSGFTLCGGATRTANNSWNQTMSGGGVLGTSNSATVYNCVIVTNAAGYLGGGAYKVTLINCTLTGNQAIMAGQIAGNGQSGAIAASGGGAESCNLTNCSVVYNQANGGNGGGVESCSLTNCFVAYNMASVGNGGGADGCNLKNCALTGNLAVFNGDGAYGSSLLNCTVTANTTPAYISGHNAAVCNSVLTNCIVFGNTSAASYPNTNYIACTMAYCCADPLPAGPGNLDVNPQLLADNIHLAGTSPCIGAGTASIISGADIDGQSWNNPPAIGCDEWHPALLLGSGTPLTYQINTPAHGLTFNIVAAGQTPFTFYWSDNGNPIQDNGHYLNSGTASLVVNNFGPSDGGLYQVVVSNSFGVVTSPVVQVVIHAVNAAGTSPVAPYSTWATAATTIQDAINAANAGDIVLVTNGLYATGGMVMAGDLTNRVALNKAIMVISVNGYSTTVIQGALDPISTNGPGAVRCAFVGDGAQLIGFTLQNGATRSTGDLSFGEPLESGGGVWCSYNGTVDNCVLSNNYAKWAGGGILGGTLNNSLVIWNWAYIGSGAYESALNNCTVTYNITTFPGSGAFDTGIIRNSIVIDNGNYYYGFPSDAPVNYAFEPSLSGGPGSELFFYNCTYPAPPFGAINGGGAFPGSNNTNVNPQFLDSFHIASTSLCRGAGSSAYATGTDLDGEPWGNPPSMGCDEVVPANLAGPLSVAVQTFTTNLFVNRTEGFTGIIIGRAAWAGWNFGDGTVVTNVGASASHIWTNSGNYPVTFTAYNNDNPGGVSASVMVYVQALTPPPIVSAGIVAGAFQFQFPGQTNANYTIQYTTNLAPPVTWNTLQTINGSGGGTVQINDSAWTNSARFYRVLAQ